MIGIFVNMHVYARFEGCTPVPMENSSLLQYDMFKLMNMYQSFGRAVFLHLQNSPVLPGLYKDGSGRLFHTVGYCVSLCGYMFQKTWIFIHV
jgi:hypothetical protein